MKKQVVVFFALLITGFSSFAQVGIGTSTPNASAKLQVDASDKGFLPPRVTLASTTDVATIATPATGLLIYNTASAGTSPNNVTPGYYFYAGNKWERLISQQPDATVSFNKATPTTSGVAFTPNIPASQDYIYVSSVDASQWTYNGSAYVTYTAPASTAWYLSGGTNDAGSNKSDAIYRSGNLGLGVSSPATRLDVRATSGDGAIGVGTSAQTAANAGAGALRYSTTSGGTLVYSNGTSWNTLSSTVQKSLVSGYFNASAYANNYFGDLATTEVLDVNGDFNPSTGTFTVPRTGNYTFSCTVSSNGASNSNALGTWEIQVVPSGGQTKMVSRYMVPTAVSTIVLTVTGAYTAQLTAGTTVTYKLYNSTGNSQTLAGFDYNRFSIVEN